FTSKNVNSNNIENSSNTNVVKTIENSLIVEGTTDISKLPTIKGQNVKSIYSCVEKSIEVYQADLNEANLNPREAFQRIVTQL
ncbi:hypothetical protein, partial [Vibrio alginolyticus]